MDLKSITQDLAGESVYRLEQRFEQLMHTNPAFHNLDASNRQIIMDFIVF